jgi:hypothetical protein
MMIPELSASKVAGFIGLHKFQTPLEIYYELLLKDTAGRAAVLALEAATGRRSFNGLLNEVLKEQPVKDCIYTGIADANKTANVGGVLEEVEIQSRLILGLRRDTLPLEVRERLVAEIRGKVSKGRGIQNENAILDQYETQREVKVTERNTKTFRKDYGSFKLVGRTDGYVASENRIVDSKDRTRWWPEVPLYDEIQLRCYMEMAGAAESELIERFPDGRVRHTKYLNDPAKWGSLQSAIESGVTKLNALLTDEEALKRVVFANTVMTEYGGEPDVRRSPRLSGTAALTGV